MLAKNLWRIKRSAHLYRTREVPVQQATQFVPTDFMVQPNDTVILLAKEKKNSEWFI